MRVTRLQRLQWIASSPAKGSRVRVMFRGSIPSVIGFSVSQEPQAANLGLLLFAFNLLHNCLCSCQRALTIARKHGILMGFVGNHLAQPRNRPFHDFQ